MACFMCIGKKDTYSLSYGSLFIIACINIGMSVDYSVLQFSMEYTVEIY